LRALFVERRPDVAPLVEPSVRQTETGSSLGMLTSKVELGTALGQLVLEQTNFAGIGQSGELLCRFLLELIGGAPSSAVCNEQMLPLKAEYRWAEHGRSSFEVSSLARRTDLPIGLVYAPPAGALFKPGELPPESSGVFLSRKSLAKFRTRDVPRATPDDKAPAEGVIAANKSDLLRYLVVDGVPVAWVRPHSERYIIGLRPGRYVIAWRDFLGIDADQRKLVEVPARVTFGKDEETRAP
jgi:hypothetical protein